MGETTDLVAGQVTKRFPAGALQEVTVLAYGDDPAVEPGGLGIRAVINTGQFREGTDPLREFHRAHDDTIRELHHDLGLLPPGSWIEFLVSAEDGKRPGKRLRLGPSDLGDLDDLRESARRLEKGRPGESTPVTARLGAAQLQTLDTLITAGIAANRAEAVRWAIDRIHDRPAFARLRERAREIDELKKQF